jgi:hypothetical protein
MLHGLPVPLIATLGAVGAAPPVTATPTTSTGTDRSVLLTVGMVLIVGLVALMLIVALRLIRRVAEGAPGFQDRMRKRTPRGAGRDPWREAGRRMRTPPRESGSDRRRGDGMGGPGGSDSGSNGGSGRSHDGDRDHGSGGGHDSDGGGSSDGGGGGGGDGGGD